MNISKPEKTINSDELMDLINQCFSETGSYQPFVYKKEIDEKAQKILGCETKSALYIFSEEQALAICYDYSLAVQAKIIKFFEEKDPMKKFTKKEESKPSKITSLEIAESKGIRHENLKRLIQRLIAQGEIPVPAKEFSQIRDKLGRSRNVGVYVFYGDSAELLETLFPATAIAADANAGAGDCVLEEIQEAAGQPAASQEIALPMVAPGAAQIMSSVALLKFVNEARAEFDEKPVRHNVFLARCKDELDGEPYKIFVEPAKGQAPAFEAIEMTQDQCKLVAMRESKGVRRRVLARLNALEAQVAQQPATSHGQPLALSQMFAMFSEQAGKIEQELRRQAQEIEALKATLLLPRPTPKLRTKNPNRASGLQDWQVAKNIKSVRFSFSISPQEIGLERFYAYLHSLNSPITQRDALRQALHFGIPLDASMPANFPKDPKTITFKFTISENDKELQDILAILLPLSDDKQRRAEVKRHIIKKSMGVKIHNIDYSANHQQGLF